MTWDHDCDSCRFEAMGVCWHPKHPPEYVQERACSLVEWCGLWKQYVRALPGRKADEPDK
jgi:hypothetical protein